MDTFSIVAYKRGTTWLFDDDSRGIQSEPFVMGASELIQRVLNSKGQGRRKKVVITFSQAPLVVYDVKLTVTEKCLPYEPAWLEGVFGDGYAYHVNNTAGASHQDIATSAWYTDEQGNTCWLCPAQLAYFGEVADVIYAWIA
jgi:hypothetical protein